MKSLAELTQQIRESEIIGNPGFTPVGITLDSRQAGEGMLFAALRGTKTDGHLFIQSAIQQGAGAILCEELPTGSFPGVTFVKSGDSAEALGQLATAFYDHPSSRLTLVGVTGTNGKTTVATLLYELFERLGFPSGLISTIRIINHKTEESTLHTTPDAITINRHLVGMVNAGCSHAFMEVSSHALEQKRTSGLKFAGGIFTNLTHDHLDYHAGFDAYLRAKKSFFDALPAGAFALTNKDDRHGEVMLQNCKANHTTYASRTVADFQAKLMEQHIEGMQIEMDGQEIWSPFIGRFNVSNLLAVYSAARLLGVDKEQILSALTTLHPVEGRLEKVTLAKGVTGMVDYAHTPDALEKVLTTLQDLRSGSCRIITLFGAGGDRDKSKRPVMARVACRLSDKVIITSDNPRSEDPEVIIQEIRKGVPPEFNQEVFCITNRREAIRVAIALAQPGDMILIAGKGHETYQEIHGVRYHFDDREILREATLSGGDIKEDESNK